MFDKAALIKKDICKKYGIRMAVLEGDIKTRTITNARTEAIGRIRDETCLSYKEIASLLGRRHHTTIIHACRRYKKNPERFNLEG